ncbi:MAG: response regulator transcription factor [Chloroflexi bacterium]|nr:response regulator transcription factor [Chloroflexota bacterium]
MYASFPQSDLPPILFPPSLTSNNGSSDLELDEPTRVLVVASHAAVRRSLAALIEALDGLQLVGEAMTSEEALEKSEKTSPHVVLVDLAMPGNNGLSAITALQNYSKPLRIIALTILSDHDRQRPTLRQGLVTLLPKTVTGNDLVQIIRNSS